MMRKVLGLAVLPVILLVVPVMGEETADVGPLHDWPGVAGLGDVVAGPFDVQNPANPPANASLGVEHYRGTGGEWFYVTGRSLDDNILNIYQYDMNGNLLNKYPQTSQSPTWGHRDMASDETANKLWAGEENNRLVEYDVNPATGALSHSTTYTIPGGPGTIRALARNPQNGHFYSVSFRDPIYEFDLGGNVHNVFANTLDLAFYGMAWDPANKSLWGWSQDGPDLQQVLATEFDLDMTPTDRSFLGALISDPNLAGGADIYFDDPRNMGRYSFVGLHQTDPDSIVVYDLKIPEPASLALLGLGGLALLRRRR